MTQTDAMTLTLGEGDLQRRIETAWDDGIRKFTLSGTYIQEEPTEAILDIHAGLSGIMLTGDKSTPMLNGNQVTSHVVRVRDAWAYISGLVICGGDTTDSKRVAQQHRGSRLTRLYPVVDGAGVLVLGESIANITECAITNNHAGMCGGGLSNQSRGLVQFTDCIFEQNSARHTGPAIDNLTPGAQLQVMQTKFRNNTADRHHGQITVFPRTIATIHECDFEGSFPIDAPQHGLVVTDKNNYFGSVEPRIPGRANPMDWTQRVGWVASYEWQLFIRGVLAAPVVGRPKVPKKP